MKKHRDAKHPFGLCKIQRLKDASRFFCHVPQKLYLSAATAASQQWDTAVCTAPHPVAYVGAEKRDQALWSTCSSYQSRKRQKQFKEKHPAVALEKLQG